MCVLVEMLTGQKPWQHRFACDSAALLYLVKNTMRQVYTTNVVDVACLCYVLQIGCYRDEQMERELLPPSPQLDPDFLNLMRLVFRAEQSERMSALNLLDHPLIVNGEEMKGKGGVAGCELSI